MNEKNANSDLNPFPTSAKPVFIRIGLLIIGIICLWLVFHYLDQSSEPEESQVTTTQNQPTTNTQLPPENTKYKVTQENFGE